LLLKLVDDLFGSPATTVPRAARLLGMTSRAAQGNIDRLIEFGLLREMTGRKRNRVFVAETILRILDEDPASDTVEGTVQIGSGLPTVDIRESRQLC
jgi:hypothetical protein